MAGKEGIWEEEEEEGVVYRKGLLWLPADEALIRSIMKSDHDTRIAGYIGQDKTLELVCRNFRWAEGMAAMSEGQGGAPPTLRAAQPTRAPLHFVVVNCHGRYRRPPVIRGMRPTLGGYRPIHQNSALPLLPKDGKTASGRAEISPTKENKGTRRLRLPNVWSANLMEVQETDCRREVDYRSRIPRILEKLNG